MDGAYGWCLFEWRNPGWVSWLRETGVWWKAEDASQFWRLGAYLYLVNWNFRTCSFDLHYRSRDRTGTVNIALGIHETPLHLTSLQSPTTQSLQIQP